MKTLAFVFSYNRPETLKASLTSLRYGSTFKPSQIVLIDDDSNERGGWEADFLISWAHETPIYLETKLENKGLSDSARIAMKHIRAENPDFVLFIEGDYVFRKHGLDCVMDCLTNTPEGDSCLGIVGYDHPNFRMRHYTEGVFPACMRLQVGEDNVNREALHKPRMVDSGLYNYSLELVSNTCWSCYLHWGNIMKVAAEFPELNDLLDQACSPRENPKYPDSGKYKAQRTVDDGMLSHALSLCWNRYAIIHGIDRNRYGAWLNIRPSVAEHRFQGGTNFG